MKPRVFTCHKPSDHRLADLRAGKVATFCLPCKPSTCTVLGYRVTAKSQSWQVLDWKKSVMIDGVEQVWQAVGAQYLHVATKEDAVYRVRPLPEIGDPARVMGFDGECEIVNVTVAGFWDGLWQWRFHVAPKGSGDPAGCFSMRWEEKPIEEGHRRWNLIMPSGKPAATVWDNGTWHTWDTDGVGGENDVEKSIGEAKRQAVAAVVAQGFHEIRMA